MYKYLGLLINKGKKTFQVHWDKIISKTKKLNGLTYRAAKRSFNKPLITKVMWTTVTLPSVTYGWEILPPSQRPLAQLVRLQCQLLKDILGLPKLFKQLQQFFKSSQCPLFTISNLFIHNIQSYSITRGPLSIHNSLSTLFSLNFNSEARNLGRFLK